MRREDVQELHSIQAIDNVSSVLSLGLLSHRNAEDLLHVDISDRRIQDLRTPVRVPNGLPLHEYACLYFHARNPMMSRRRGEHARLCVLRIAPTVLDLADVVVTDGNASSDYVRFGAASEGLGFISKEWVFAMDWRDPDTITYWRKKTARCAEVLVPDRVDRAYILGAYCCRHGYDRLRAAASNLAIEIDDDLFFC